jgi:Family of unknown function (DUF6262)
VPDEADRNDRVERLRLAASTRSAEAIARAHRAITALAARGEAVTFASVAAEAGVSESFLYKHQELGDRVREARKPVGRPKARSTKEAASAASLRVQLDVVTDRLAKAHEKIVALTSEVEMLRGTVADLRARARRPSSPDD